MKSEVKRSELRLRVSAQQFRALSRLAEEWLAEDSLEVDAAGAVLMVALANIHLLRPHFWAAHRYCLREKVPFWAYLEGQIKHQFRGGAKKGGAR